jgi:hypothetical protein
VADLAGAPLLARLPLDPQLAALSDIGQIESIEQPELAALVRNLEERLPQTQTYAPAELVVQ